MSVLGAAVGTAVSPGFGTLIGAALGNALERAFVGAPSTKKRVFVSFDYDRDLSLKHFIIGQSRNDKSPFEIVDCSLQEAAPQVEWVARAAAAIASADLLMVMVGEHTHRSSGVLIEVSLARQLGVKCVQIRGYRDRYCPPVDGAGRMYDWSWDKLDHIMG